VAQAGASELVVEGGAVNPNRITRDELQRIFGRASGTRDEALAAAAAKAEPGDLVDVHPPECGVDQGRCDCGAESVVVARTRTI